MNIVHTAKYMIPVQCSSPSSSPFKTFLKIFDFFHNSLTMKRAFCVDLYHILWYNRLS